ncbi:heparan sulfate glucosamine 3-O-sulfotransferase 2-like [Saccoglossus kowalevskii]|uniref:Heparan sulfate glucosamine 3-O-sulfotransferase 2-like n=1 Tax=Saccoglossus kowalevskii TaxID=10224 RepID=A0ABM0MLL3_SACKO|nr:PREDICTED: heparan sulfate glucosamine 3-O-sulfotransferase 2-like [Saccoglossus kowalevskii]
MKDVFFYFALLFTGSLPFVVMFLNYSHYHDHRAHTLSRNDDSDTVKEESSSRGERPEIASDVGTNLTTYIRTKFGHSCYREEAFDMWWERYYLDDELLVADQAGCGKRLSDVFIIGAKKCASDAVRDLLAIHPYVMFSRTRSAEIHFYDRHYKQGVDWYRNQFSYAREWQLILEKTPQTISFPEDAPRKMATEANQNTKIVAILCDPVVRAMSDYEHELKVKWYKIFNPPYYRIIRKSFKLSVFNESGLVDAGNELINMGMYSKHMKRWLEYFPKTQIHLADGNDFKLDPVSEIQKIETFLGLPNFVQQKHLDFTRSKFYCIIFPRLRCPQLRIKGREHPTLPDEDLAKLYDFYRPYDIELQQLFNRTFSWISNE